MALVKKYQNAAGPLPEGKFTMNGKHLLGQQALERIAAAYELDKNGPKDMYSIATRAIKDGNEAIYDPTENTIQILDSTGKDITSNYVGKGITASINDSTLKRNLGATFNTKNHRFKQSGLLLANVDMDTRKELRRGSGWFDTNNEAYDVNSILNKDREDLIKSLLNYAVDTNNVDDIYKYSNWNNADRTQLRNLGNELLAYKGGVEGYSTDFINRLHSGNLSEGDLNLLRLMGFEKPVPPVVETPVDPDPADGDTGGEDDEGDEGGKPENGEGDTPEEGVVRGADGRYYLNGDAYKDSVWYLGGFDNFANTDYENGFAINGTVYSLDEVLKDRSFDPYVAKFITAGRTAKDWNSWYDAANASGVRFLDDRLWTQEHNGIEDTSTYYGGYQNYNSDVYSPMYYDYFTNAKILGGGVKDLTPWFKDTKGYNILSYVSPNNENQAGVMTPQYLVYLGNGEYSDPYSDLNTLAKDYELEVDPYNKYIQTTLPLNAWNNGFAEHARFKTADGTQENTIVRDKNGTWYLQANNKVWEIPKENLESVYALLEQGTDFDNKQIKNLIKTPTDIYTVARRLSPLASLHPLFTLPVAAFNYGAYKKTHSSNDVGKYQIGGALTSSSHINGTTLGKYEEPKTPRKHDVTKAHNLDGSNGGLTQAEQLQIMGAIADLGGVVSSFAGPVGGAIGAGAGLTGTGLRFMGDLKQGEKSTWGAVKDLAINTAFDLAALPASLVPGLDNAIKASKFVRVVKGIGTPILKYMGTIGLSSALINTASKIINGEKYTSEDLINLANGLSGGIVAGKQWSKQLGDARLAAKASGKAAEAANANLRGEFNTRIGNQNLTLKNEDIANIVTEAKGNRALVINKLISKANEAGITMTEDQAAKALADFNISAKKQNLFAKIFKKSKVEFEEPTPQEGNSTAHYFFHSNLRNRALGNYRPNDKQANVVKSLTKEDYDNALFENGVPKRTKDYTWEGALRRLGAQNPGALGFRTTENTEQFVMPWQFGRRANIRQSRGSAPYATPATGMAPDLSRPATVIYRLPAHVTPDVGTNIDSGPVIRQGYTPTLLLTRGTNTPVRNIPTGDVILGNENLDTANKAVRTLNSPVI